MARTFSNVSVQQGSTMVFSHYDSGGPMWTGIGPREERQRVDFDTSFGGAPAVHVSVGLWDVETSSNFRADIFADEITAGGFTVVVRTWGDTRMARLRADWMAIGPGIDPDVWQIE